MTVYRALVGEVVRVWDGPHTKVRAEGEVIGLIECPTLVIRRPDGTLAHEPVSLPRDVQTWESG